MVSFRIEKTQSIELTISVNSIFEKKMQTSDNVTLSWRENF